jgi:hypothetical protein
MYIFKESRGQKHRIWEEKALSTIPFIILR